MINPVAFDVFGRPVYWFGIMMALAFLSAVVHLSWLGKKEGRAPGFASDLSFWIIVGGVVGARLAYVIANWSDFSANPISLFRIDQGGLIYYGGLLGSVLSGLLFAQLKKEPKWALADFTITSIPFAHMMGRIGCFVNGCCYGRETDVPWSILVHSTHRHPAPIYEALFNLGLYGVLVWFYLRKPRAGRVVALYLILYPIGRFIVEFFRGDDRQTWLGLHLAQSISVGLFLTGLVIWNFTKKTKPLHP